MKSLESVNIYANENDIKFIEDDWESPTLGAAGLGWEVQCNGMEISQFTYFQQIGGFDCKPVSLELTYGLERLAMFVQNIDNVFEIIWDNNGTKYGDVFKKNEEQQSYYNFLYAPDKDLYQSFNNLEDNAEKLIEKKNLSYLLMNHVLKLVITLIYSTLEV